MPSISSTATSPAIDLSALPPPVLVPQPGYEARMAAKLARLEAALPGFTALVESDPAIKLIEADAYDEILLAQQFNDAARQMLVAFASGANLDQLGALYGVTRLTITPANPPTVPVAVLESDSEFRARILMAPHSFSVAGPERAYVYHALSASSDVLDASATSPEPGEVVVSVLSRTGTGVAPAPTLAAVTARLTNDAVRPMTDAVTVQSAAIVNFAVEAQLFLFAGPDANLIGDAALASVNAYLASAKRLGRDVPRTAIIAALHVAGVQRVNLIHPAADVACSPLQAGHCTGVTLSTTATGE